LAVFPAISRGPTGRYNWELTYVSEFAAKYYPNDKVKTYVRLGRDPSIGREAELEPGEAALLSVGMRWADAIIIRDKDLLVIEGKLRPGYYPEGLAKLELYLPLVPHTPDLQEFMPRKVEGILVIPLDDPAVSANGRSKGFRVVIYKPKWFPEFLASLTPRARRPPKST
jgi:hypothetical protein